MWSCTPKPVSVREPEVVKNEREGDVVLCRNGADAKMSQYGESAEGKLILMKQLCFVNTRMSAPQTPPTVQIGKVAKSPRSLRQLDAVRAKPFERKVIIFARNLNTRGQL